jgi:hypothetical protein
MWKDPAVLFSHSREVGTAVFVTKTVSGAVGFLGSPFS